MGLFHKKKAAQKAYDKENLVPAIRASICTGEQVAGFQEIHSQKFIEEMLIRNEEDLELFRETFGIEGEIKKIY